MSISAAAPRGNIGEITEVSPNATTSKTIVKETDIKTYSLARRIIQGLAMILLNIFTIATINFWAAFRDEYLPVFGFSPFTQSTSSNTSSSQKKDSVDETLNTSPDKPTEEPLRHPHFDRIFCGDSKENPPRISVTVPQAIRESLDTLFGIPNVVERIPTYNEIFDNSFDIDQLPSPIMKGRDSSGTPYIFIKLKAINSEECYRILFKDTIQFVREAAVEKGQSPDEAEASFKRAKLREISGKTYFLRLGQQYRNADPLLWSVRTSEDNNRPYFLGEQMTYEDDGKLLPRLESNIPEFQKLFSAERVGKDQEGLEWTLATDGL